MYGNGGSVSAETAGAVKSFCDAIDTAGIRDRFYRLNIFAGSNLNAALTPLYLGPTPLGGRYGNTTDTNTGPFVSGDYVETGASGGLTGNGTSKYLQTGLPGDAITAGNRHLSAYENLRDTNTFRTMLGTQDDGAGTYYFSLGSGSPGSTVSYNFGSGVSVTSQTTGGHWVGTDPTSSTAVIYKNGTSVASSASASRSQPGVRGILVFATNQLPSAVSPASYYAGRLNAYSIGLGMAASQAAAYYTAMQAFQTALTRNV